MDTTDKKISLLSEEEELELELENKNQNNHIVPVHKHKHKHHHNHNYVLDINGTSSPIPNPPPPNPLAPFPHSPDPHVPFLSVPDPLDPNPSELIPSAPYPDEYPNLQEEHAHAHHKHKHKHRHTHEHRQSRPEDPGPIVAVAAQTPSTPPGQAPTLAQAQAQTQTLQSILRKSARKVKIALTESQDSRDMETQMKDQISAIESAKEVEARAEYASHPREFTKTGTPIPFWQLEMKKGTEYILRLHRRYGRREKHERVAAYKPDLEVISVNSKDSFQDDDEEELLAQLGHLYHNNLVHLMPVDKLFLFHREDIVHGICFTKVLNSYHITNHHGHLLYRVAENKRCLRHKTYTFTDFDGNVIIHIQPTTCATLTWLFYGGYRKYFVYCPADQSIGSIVQSCKCFCQDPGFSIRDENGTEIITFHKLSQKIKVRKNPDLIFEYKSVRGQGPLGMITIKLADLKLVNFTERDYYGIKINEALSPNIKVRIMAAWFIIYRIFYKGRTHHDVHHALTKPAKIIFEDHKPSTEEIPTNFQEGKIAYNK